MAAIPTKLFDVRSGSNAVDADGTVYPSATITVFRDAAAKTKILQSFATVYNYQATVTNPAFDPTKPIDAVTNPQTIPNPQSQQGFFNAKVTQFIKDVHTAATVQPQTAAAAAAGAASAAAELP